MNHDSFPLGLLLNSAHGSQIGAHRDLAPGLRINVRSVQLTACAAAPRQAISHYKRDKDQGALHKADDSNSQQLETVAPEPREHSLPNSESAWYHKR